MQEIRERFFSKVNLDGPTPPHVPELGPCHVFKQNCRGYGIFGFERRSVPAHRMAFFLEHGRWPQPCCLHKCDNPKCVRVSHLFEGTMAANCRDRDAKGRARGGSLRGETNPNAKLTENEVRAIRAAAGTNLSIARRFGISNAMVSMIRTGKAWRHLANDDSAGTPPVSPESPEA